ncbi:hypothetical protein JYU20_00495 [Bacteroidales bacterium AH-315-I05]|nr:hypothetical protein [Bacteroidales bacterium AH-315-I05]
MKFVTPTAAALFNAKDALQKSTAKADVLHDETAEFEKYVKEIGEGKWDIIPVGMELGPLTKEYAAHIDVNIPDDYTMPQPFAIEGVQKKAISWLAKLKTDLAAAEATEKANKELLEKAQKDFDIAQASQVAAATEADKEKEKEVEREKIKADSNVQMARTLVFGALAVIGLLVVLKVFKVI